jgi:3-hydroxybutyryl-CoA dehydratase
MNARVSTADVEQFAQLSGDQAPLHTDAQFATQAGFEAPVVHGAFLIALLSRLVGMEFPGPGALLERVDLAFRKPCYAPCELVLAAKVRQVSEAVASVILDVEISDARGQVLASGKTWHRILRPA